MFATTLMFKKLFHQDPKAFEVGVTLNDEVTLTLGSTTLTMNSDAVFKLIAMLEAAVTVGQE